MTSATIRLNSASLIDLEVFSVLQYLRDADLGECVSRSNVHGSNIVMSSVEGRVAMTGADGYLIIADVGTCHELDRLGIAVVGQRSQLRSSCNRYALRDGLVLAVALSRSQ